MVMGGHSPCTCADLAGPTALLGLVNVMVISIGPSVTYESTVNVLLAATAIVFCSLPARGTEVASQLGLRS